MGKQLFIRFPAEPTEPIQWLLWQEAPIEQGEIALAQLTDLSQLSQQAITVVLLPGDQVCQHTSELEGNRRLALQALPYQLEELFSEPIEDLHIATGNPVSNLVVSHTISHARMTDYLEILRDAQIEVRAIHADYAPLPTDQLYGWQDRNRILIRSHESGLTLPMVLFPAWQQQNQQPLILYSDNALITEHIEQRPAPANILSLMAEHYQPGNCINLLQGAYQQQDPLLNTAKQLRWPAMTATLCGLLYIATLYIEIHSLKSQITQNTQAIKAEFKQSFPQARNLVRPKAQMRYQLDQLQATSTSKPSVLGLIEVLTPLIHKPALQTKALLLQANTNSLEIELSSNSIAPLQRLAEDIDKALLPISLGPIHQHTYYYQRSISYSMAESEE